MNNNLFMHSQEIAFILEKQIFYAIVKNDVESETV